jgi:hypothetical protein
LVSVFSSTYLLRIFGALILDKGALFRVYGMEVNAAVDSVKGKVKFG